MSTYQHEMQAQMANWTLTNTTKAREERSASLEGSLDRIYEGYYPEEE